MCSAVLHCIILHFIDVEEMELEGIDSRYYYVVRYGYFLNCFFKPVQHIKPILQTRGNMHNPVFIIYIVTRPMIYHKEALRSFGLNIIIVA